MWQRHCIMATPLPFLSLLTRKTWYICKIIATSGFVAALERIKFVFGRGFAPDPAGGAYSVPQTPTERKGREGKGRTGPGPPFANFWIRPRIPWDYEWNKESRQLNIIQFVKRIKMTFKLTWCTKRRLDKFKISFTPYGLAHMWHISNL